MKEVTLKYKLPDAKTEKTVREQIIKILSTVACQEVSYNGYQYPGKPVCKEKEIKIPECIKSGRRQPGLLQRKERFV